jgi:hypothetical protein
MKNSLSGSFVVLLIVALASCSDSEVKKQTPTKKVNPDSLKYATFLEKFNSLEFDTLEVYSLNSIDDSNYLFKGTSLDSLEIALLTDEFTSSRNSDMGYFACGKFKVNDSLTALILRVPSEYDPSDIYLFYYNNLRHHLIPCLPLSVSFGDAGDVFVKNSWIINNDSIHIVFTEDLTEHYNVVDDPEDNSVTREQQRYKYTLPACTADTLNDIQKDWPKEL